MTQSSLSPPQPAPYRRPAAQLAALRELVDKGISVTEAARTLKIGRSTAYAAPATNR